MIGAILKNGSQLLSRRQSTIFSAATILAITFSISAVLGILRDRLLYARFYACCALQLDAYNGAFRIPDIIFRLLVTGAISAAFIPVFSEQLARNKKQAYRTASSVINILFLTLLGLIALVSLFSYPLSALIAAGFSQKQVILMSRLTRLMVFAQLFFLLSNFLTGVLQSNQRFLLPALAPLAYNLGIIFGIQILTPSWGIFGPALGVIIGASLHFFIQLPLVLALGFNYFPIISFRLVGVKKILRLMLPRTISLGLREIGVTAILFLASTLPTGSLSLFYLGQRLTQFLSRLFGVTIGQASLPILSREAGKRRFDLFRKTLFDSLLQAVYLALPAAAILLVLRVSIVRLAYGAEKFPWRATIITGRVVAFFTPVVFINTVIDILIRGFYALQDTKTPLIISFFSLIINVFAAFLAIFYFRLGVAGLALAIVLAGLIQAVMLANLLLRKIRAKEIISSLLLPILKMIFSSLIAAIVVWLLLRGLDRYVFDTSRTIGLLVLTIINVSAGLLCYLFITLLFGLSQAKAVLGLIQRVVDWFKFALPLIELPPVE